MKSMDKAYVQVVLLGDSITWSAQVPFGKRYGDYLEAMLQARLGGRFAVDVAVCGDGGNTVGQGLERAERDCLAYEPHLVLVNLGCNNLLRETETVEPDLRALIERVRARRPEARIILETIPTVDEKRHAYRNNQELLEAGGLNKACEERAHAVIRRLASEYGFPVHDRFRFFQRALKARPALNEALILGDGVHLTAAGNRYFARNAAALLAEAAPRHPAVSARPAAAWLELAEQNPAYAHAIQCLAQGGLALFLRSSGCWSRLMFQQSRSFARRAAWTTSARTVRERALSVSALAAAFSALQRALPPEAHQRPTGENIRWLRQQIEPFRSNRQVKRMSECVRSLTG
jgi:lysophospholipase L1-like esterase